MRDVRLRFRLDTLVGNSTPPITRAQQFSRREFPPIPAHGHPKKPHLADRFREGHDAPIECGAHARGNHDSRGSAEDRRYPARPYAAKAEATATNERAAVEKVEQAAWFCHRTPRFRPIDANCP